MRSRRGRDPWVRDRSPPGRGPPASHVTPRRLLTRRRRRGNAFDLGGGAVFGLLAGYRADRVRVEVEYLTRSQGPATAAVGATTNVVLQGKDTEWSDDQPPREWIRDYAAHQIFANLYYDFPNESPWTPYVGGGLGVAITTLHYANQFIRKPDAGAALSEEGETMRRAGRVGENHTDAVSPVWSMHVAAALSAVQRGSGQGERCAHRGPTSARTASANCRRFSARGRTCTIGRSSGRCCFLRRRRASRRRSSGSLMPGDPKALKLIMEPPQHVMVETQDAPVPCPKCNAATQKKKPRRTCRSRPIRSRPSNARRPCSV